MMMERAAIGSWNGCKDFVLDVLGVYAALVRSKQSVLRSKVYKTPKLFMS